MVDIGAGNMAMDLPNVVRMDSLITPYADLVADARASTPTKAGVVAVPDMRKVLADLQNCRNSLYNNITLSLNYCRQQLDESQDNIADAIKEFLSERRQRLYESFEQLTKIEPHRLLGKMRDDLNALQNRVGSAIQQILNKRRMALTAQSNLLTGLNPKSVLKRGYSITTDKQTGRLIKKPDDVKLGDLLVTELAEEKLLESKVTKK